MQIFIRPITVSVLLAPKLDRGKLHTGIRETFYLQYKTEPTSICSSVQNLFLKNQSRYTILGEQRKGVV